MGRKLSAADFPPSAELRVEGATFRGVFNGSREVNTKWGKKLVFQLKVMDADCSFKKNKMEYEPDRGELVEVMGTTTLTAQLLQVKPGEIVTIKYAGLGTATKGNPPHLFDVEVD